MFAGPGKTGWREECDRLAAGKASVSEAPSPSPLEASAGLSRGQAAPRTQMQAKKKNTDRARFLSSRLLTLAIRGESTSHGPLFKALPGGDPPPFLRPSSKAGTVISDLYASLLRTARAFRAAAASRSA